MVSLGHRFNEPHRMLPFVAKQLRLDLKQLCLIRDEVCCHAEHCLGHCPYMGHELIHMSQRQNKKSCIYRKFIMRTIRISEVFQLNFLRHI